MIRPFTLICAGLAIGSGLYLYQSKHSVLLLDRKIEKIVKDTDQVRDQTRLLHAEWMLLNDPERLRQLADRHLALRAVAPSQFTSLAELGNRLPAPLPPEPEPAPAPATETPPMAAADPTPEPAVPTGVPTATPAEEAPSLVAEEENLPLPPVPVMPPPMIAHAAPVAPTPVASPPIERRPAPRPAAVAQTDQPSTRPPLQAQESRVTAARGSEQRPSETRVAAPVRPPLQHSTRGPVQQVSLPAPIPLTVPSPTPRQAPPVTHPAPVARAVPAAPVYAPQTAAPAYGGSMLGMARGSVPVPLPRPTPISSNAFAGGG